MELPHQNMTPEGLTAAMTSSSNNVITETTKKSISSVASSPTALIVHGCLYGVLLALGMMFNCCVLWLIRHKRSLHTVTNMWVTSLCISQVLLCAISLPIMILSVIADDWLLGSVFCRIFGFYTTCLRTVSILSVAGIAIDRYHVVTRPFSARIRKSSARFLIILTWWCGLVAATPPMIGIGLYRYSSNSHMCGVSWSLGGSALISTVFYVTAVYILSFMTSTLSYKFIYQVTKNQVQKRRRPSIAGGLATSVSSGNMRMRSEAGHVNESVMDDEPYGIANDVTSPKRKDSPAKKRLMSVFPNKRSKSHVNLRSRISSSLSGVYMHGDIDSKAAQSIALVLSVFFITWVPYFAFALYMASVKGSGLSYPHTTPQQGTSALAWIEFGTTWLTFSNVIWDPLLYGALNHNFRSHLRELYCCGKMRMQELFKPQDRNFGNGDIYDDNHKKRASSVAANWRAILRSEEEKTENAAYFRRNTCIEEDSQEQMSESARTMTSVDGDVILSTPSSRRQSQAGVRNSGTPKIFFTPVNEEEAAHHDFQTFSRSSSFLTAPKTPTRKGFQTSPARSVHSQRFVTPLNTSRGSVLDDVISERGISYFSTPSTKRRGRSSSAFSTKNEIINHSPRHLPVALTGTSRSELSPFRLNERLTSSRRFNKDRTFSLGEKSKRENVGPENGGDIFFKKNNQKERKRSKYLSKSYSTRATPVPTIHDPFKRRFDTLSFSNISVDSSERRSAAVRSSSRSMDNENVRIRRQRNTSLPGYGRRYNYNKRNKRKQLHQSATAL